MAFDLVKELQSGKSVYIQQAFAPDARMNAEPRKITDFPEIVAALREKMVSGAPGAAILKSEKPAASTGKGILSIPQSNPQPNPDQIIPDPVVSVAQSLNIHKL